VSHSVQCHANLAGCWHFKLPLCVVLKQPGTGGNSGGARFTVQHTMFVILFLLQLDLHPPHGATATSGPGSPLDE